MYDLAIIGSGPGGYVAALHAAKLGLSVVCIDKEKTLGGTCLNVGCIPSKALLQSSEHFAFLQNEAKEHGILAKSVQLDFAKMMERKKEVVTSLTEGVKGLFTRANVTSMKGHARFVSPNELDVEGEKVQAKNIIIATGSEPAPLPFLPFDEKTIVSSTGVLALPKLPKSLLVVGAGVIGVELASVYRRLGTEVTLVEMLDHICTGMDKEVCKGLLKILKKQGLTFHLSTKVKEAKGTKLTIEQGGKTSHLSADIVLVAIGRRPYTENLGLENIGISKDERGFINVDNNFRTHHSHIYAIGDVIEGPMLAHLASDEGVAAVDLIAGRATEMDYLTVPNVIYTHPEAAGVGITEEEAKALGIETKVALEYFKANARARCAGDIDGFVKLIADKASDRLIGMHILGPHASEMIGEGVLAIKNRMTIKELAYASHAHPTLSEAIKEAATHFSS